VTIASPRREASRIGHGLRLNSVFRCPEARVGCFLAVQGTGIQTVNVKPAEEHPLLFFGGGWGARCGSKRDQTPG
jgi:hypothetical protein